MIWNHHLDQLNWVGQCNGHGTIATTTTSACLSINCLYFHSLSMNFYLIQLNVLCVIVSIAHIITASWSVNVWILLFVCKSLVLRAFLNLYRICHWSKIQSCAEHFTYPNFIWFSVFFFDRNPSFVITGSHLYSIPIDCISNHRFKFQTK